jgi:NAD(P)H dehydrogenase (quinone)
LIRRNDHSPSDRHEEPRATGVNAIMRHAVIVAHPNDASFTLAVARTYAKTARQRGHETVLRDLYRLDFDPRLKSGEIPQTEGFGPAPDVIEERAVLEATDVFVLVYPLWFYAPPAMIKGYIDRVFGMGFGFGGIQGGGNSPLLRGRKLLSFTSSGSPIEWIEQEGAWTAIRTLFDDHLAQVCGLTVLDHIHAGGVTLGMRPDAVAAHLDKVCKTVERLF